VADLATLSGSPETRAPHGRDTVSLTIPASIRKRWAERYGVPIKPPSGSHDSQLA